MPAQSPGPALETSATALTTARLAAVAVPGAVVGVLSALGLILVSSVAGAAQDWLWDTLPAAVGTQGDSPWWILGTLTLTGLVVGAIVAWFPGHAGDDPATTSLVAAPLPPRTVPGLALALAVGLAGGVSLGPENPIIAVNVALAVWVVARLRLGAPQQVVILMAASGTLGAMFGTPVGAALLMTEMLAGRGKGELFDRLFGPLVAAGAGSLTMVLFGAPQLNVEVPAYTPAALDLVTGSLVAIAAALLCLAGVWAFPLVHRAFHALRHPVLALGAGGLVLGVLGVLGGPLSLFKGLDEMKELTRTADQYGVWALLGLGVVKIVALVVAAGAGFRGGRIFPAVFVGVAVALAAHAAFPGIPLAIAVAAAVLGATMVVARDGWLALFMGVAMVADVAVLPVLCVIVLPLWLLVRHRPLMLITPAGERAPA
ncbi:ion channel protein [Isoptericola sp. NPDC057653]|uniref:ion channel protein n=1 Tax=unclassified Isoptericola TaxID=2623355 RepID=UPI0036B07B31